MAILPTDFQNYLRAMEKSPDAQKALGGNMQVNEETASSSIRPKKT